MHKHIISDGTARRIAAEWHGGQTTALCSFATTGMIDDRVQIEVDAEIKHLEQVVPTAGDWAADHGSNLADLMCLAAYLENAGHRTPVAGWSRVWE